MTPRGEVGMEQERWWHILAQVCQGWRNLILGLPMACHVFRSSVQMAASLKHSPPIPLTVDRHSENGIMEEG